MDEQLRELCRSVGLPELSGGRAAIEAAVAEIKALGEALDATRLEVDNLRAALRPFARECTHAEIATREAFKRAAELVGEIEEDTPSILTGKTDAQEHAEWDALRGLANRELRHLPHRSASCFSVSPKPTGDLKS